MEDRHEDRLRERRRKRKGKLIKCKSAERAVPQHRGTTDLDLLETEREEEPGEGLAARVDIRKNE